MEALHKWKCYDFTVVELVVGKESFAPLIFANLPGFGDA